MAKSHEQDWISLGHFERGKGKMGGTTFSYSRATLPLPYSSPSLLFGSPMYKQEGGNR